MSKKSKRPARWQRSDAPHQESSATARQLTLKLAEAQSQMAHGHLDRARALLEDLDRRHRDQEEVIRLLLSLEQLEGDLDAFQRDAERLLRLAPENPEVAMALATSYAAGGQPAHGLRILRGFLERWPDHPDAARAREGVAAMEETLREALPALGVEGEEAVEVAAQHERVYALLNQNRWPEARRLAEEVLRRHPHVIPVLNNLSLIHFMEGRVNQAIATARQVLERQPQNVHALANLVRYLCLGGQPEEARSWAEQLKAATSTQEDAWVKKAEALSFLGDDQGVLDAFEGAKKVGPNRPDARPALLYHLVAVAEMRSGREDTARRHWREALKRDRDLEMAQQNLDDLRKPVGERHAPWPYSFAYWLPPPTFQDIGKVAASVGPGQGQAAAAERRILRQHPEIAGLLPLLLDHGDPVGREFAVRLAAAANDPAMWPPLRDFALGQRGPDSLRRLAIQALQEAGQWPEGPVRLWIRGEWREVAAFSLEVYEEPQHGHSPQVEEWMSEAMEALRARQGDRAEALLQRALAVEPEAPDALNNLAYAYALQGREAESEALVRQLHERHPDYLFAAVGIALHDIRDGRLDEAEEVLKPFLSRTRLHITELAALMNARISLQVARGNIEEAKSWLDIWASFDSDNPRVTEWQSRMDLLALPSRLKALTERRRSRARRPKGT